MNVEAMSGVRRGQPARAAHGQQIREEATPVVRRPDPRRALRVVQTRVRSRATRLASEEAHSAGAPPGAPPGERGSTRARVQGDVRKGARPTARAYVMERWREVLHTKTYVMVAWDHRNDPGPQIIALCKPFGIDPPLDTPRPGIPRAPATRDRR